MIKKIKTEKAPAAIGPYSQAIAAGDFVYTSGQIPLSPATGEIVGNTVAEQTEGVEFIGEKVNMKKCKI